METASELARLLPSRVEFVAMKERRHGTLTKYTHDDCRCAPCRAAMSEYQRKRRARNPNAQARVAQRTNVISLPTHQTQATGQPKPMGEVERATREQCAAADARGDAQAGIKAAAIRLSQLIDDDEFKAQMGQNIIKLQRLLAQLGPPKRKMTARANQLATVSAMSRRARAQ